LFWDHPGLAAYQRNPGPRYAPLRFAPVLRTPTKRWSGSYRLFEEKVPISGVEILFRDILLNQFVTIFQK